MRSKKALINVISTVIFQIIAIICGFIIPKLLIENYGSNVNGIVVSITQFLAYITLLEAGFGPVIKSVLYKPIANNDKSTIEGILKTSQNIFRKISYLFVVYLIILCIIFPMLVSDTFDVFFTVSLLVIIAISTFAEYFFGMTYKLYLHAMQKSYITSIINISTLIVNTFLVILLINCGASIHMVKIMSTAVFVFRPLLTFLYVRNRYGISLNKVESNYPIKQKWDGLAQHVAGVIHKNADIVLLTIFSTASEISVYSIYMLIVNSVKNVVQSFTDGMESLFGDIWAKGEEVKLNNGFKMYECIYNAIATVFFTATALLIIPFIKVYTADITDANYIRTLFAYIFILGEFICVIRWPYLNIVKSAGHFKQTSPGAWVEAMVNITISLVLVLKYGIIGVAIGTLVAMLIRTIELMIYVSKNILNRSLKYIIKNIFVICVEIALVLSIFAVIPSIEVVNFFDWFYEAILVVLLSISVVVIFNYLFYRKEIYAFIGVLKNIFKVSRNL